MSTIRLALALLALALAAMIVVALYRTPVMSTEECAREYVFYIGKLMPLMEQFGEARRSSFYPPESLAKMRDAWQAADDFAEPACLSAAHEALLTAWNEEIEQYIAKFQEKPQAVIDAHKKKQEESMAEFDRLVHIAIGSTPTPSPK